MLPAVVVEARCVFWAGLYRQRARCGRGFGPVGPVGTGTGGRLYREPSDASGVECALRRPCGDPAVSQPVSTPPDPPWLKLLSLDGRLCLRLNRISQRDRPGRFFAAVSRLGDGWFWYALILMLPLLHGRFGALVSLHLVLTGVCCLLVYRWVKRSTSRPRPFHEMPGLIRREPPLDEFSFPSGHTLHAVGFTLVLASHLPLLAWLVLPFTLLVAVSRPVLGLHYPSDVLAGAVIGAAVAIVTITGMRWLGL